MGHKFFDAAQPYHHITGVYLDGVYVPNAVAADSEAGWVDEIVMNEGYQMLDSSGRPRTIRRFGNVTISSYEREGMELLIQAICL